MATIDTFTAVRDVFAVIGGLGTAGGLVWRVYTWRHEHAAHVEVEIANAFPTYGPHVDIAAWSLSVTAINRGDHPVHVTSAGFILPNGDESDLVILQPPYPGALPKTVQPRDSGQTWVERCAIESRGVEVAGRPLTGWVRLSTGERFESKPSVLVAADKPKVQAA